jgi:hypothetical protein
LAAHAADSFPLPGGKKGQLRCLSPAYPLIDPGPGGATSSLSLQLADVARMPSPSDQSANVAPSPRRKAGQVQRTSMANPGVQAAWLHSLALVGLGLSAELYDLGELDEVTPMAGNARLPDMRS